MNPEPSKEEFESRKIDALEAKMFQKVLFKFHHNATEGNECIFWNDMCHIRKEYLNELEKMES